MKKLLLVLILACITGASLFAWNPEDLTKFPSGMDEKSWLLNFGAGFYFPEKFSNNLIYIPQIRMTLDRNIGIGDKKLPFFIGGLSGYSGYGYRNLWFRHNISIGGRFGYHLNWDVKNLDTYAVTTLGWVIYAGDKRYKFDPGIFLCGVNIGARYFLNNVFGFWAEAGFSSFLSIFDIGVAFKF